MFRWYASNVILPCLQGLRPLPLPIGAGPKEAAGIGAEGFQVGLGHVGQPAAALAEDPECQGQILVVGLAGRVLRAPMQVVYYPIQPPTSVISPHLHSLLPCCRLGKRYESAEPLLKGMSVSN